MSADEILDLVDRDNRVIGQVRRSETDDICNVRVINVFLRDSQRRLWIPRRTAQKRAFPHTRPQHSCVLLRWMGP